MQLGDGAVNTGAWHESLNVAALWDLGDDITLVAHSFAVVLALRVAEMLESEQDICAEVIDLRSLGPLDVQTVAEPVRKTNRTLCVKKGWASYGVTAEVPLPYAKNIEQPALPDEAKIAAAALHVLGREG